MGTLMKFADNRITKMIHVVRGEKVILDFDLAELYEVQTKNLNLSVKRNIRRFPEDFMFRLTRTEWECLRLQFETSKGRGGQRYLPYAFTEQGLAMLSGILNSNKAMDVNIAIMRAFVFIRQYALSHKEISDKLIELEKKTDERFQDVYEALDYLMNKEKKLNEQAERNKIGFIIGNTGEPYKNEDGLVDTPHPAPPPGGEKPLPGPPPRGREFV